MKEFNLQHYILRLRIQLIYLFVKFVFRIFCNPLFLFYSDYKICSDLHLLFALQQGQKKLSKRLGIDITYPAKIIGDTLNTACLDQEWHVQFKERTSLDCSEFQNDRLQPLLKEGGCGMVILLIALSYRFISVSWSNTMGGHRSIDSGVNSFFKVTRRTYYWSSNS